MSGVLPPDVEYAASRASTQAIAKYFEAGGSADDTSAEGQPLLHLVQSAMVGHRHAPAVRAVLDGGPRNVDAHWLCSRGRAVPQTYFFLGLPGTHMRIRRRRQNLVACLFTDLPKDMFRHVVRFWGSDRDFPDDSDNEYQ